MNGLTLNSNGTNRIFRPDGKVAVGDEVKGAWKSVTERAANRIQYDFDGAAAEFDVSYSFNENNQLVALVPAEANGGTDSEPFTFSGKILIDDNRDIAYVLFNEAGAETTLADGTPQKIIVYGELALVPGLDKVTIELTGGGTAEIQGDQPFESSLHVEPNGVKGEENDQIRFTANTINAIAGNDVVTPAEIRFGGHWDVNDKGLYFSAGLKEGAMKIQFGGTYKGVTAGLEYSAKNGDTEVTFIIKGEHQFKPASGGEGSVNWLLKLGHEATEIKAVANFSKVNKNGGKLTLAGGFQFVKEGQKTPEMTLNLSAVYEMRNGKLAFFADLKSDGSRISYHLMLQGDYKLRNGELKFLIKLGQDDGGAQKLEFSLGTTGDTKVKAHLRAVLEKSNSGATSLSLNFDISARWVDGEPVKNGKLPAVEVDKPKILPAGTA